VLTDATRAVIEQVDWPCTIEKNYSEVNLGCKGRVRTGLDWVFERVEAAIILEDDCLPHPTFFPFCDEMLERYKNDTRVMSVAGVSFFEEFVQRNVRESYYFELIPQMTGWATWRRAWQACDPTMSQWPALRDSGALAPVLNNPAMLERFTMVWDDYYHDRPSVRSSWEGPWVFGCMSRGAACIMPSVNLISNIGFNERGTHAKTDHPQANLPTHAMHFPLIHPKDVVINQKADALFLRYSLHVDEKWRYRLARPVKNRFPGLYRALKRLLKP